MHELQRLLLRRYPLNEPEPRASRYEAARSGIENLCSWFMNEGLADQNFLSRLCDDSDYKYWQTLTEALLAAELHNTGVELAKPHPGGGPDLRAVHEGKNVWIELTVPQPEGVCADYLQPSNGQLPKPPYDAILLRWTHAIKEKTEKLLGSEREPTGYLGKQVVQTNDAYVIGINGRMLRQWAGDFNGRSGHPFAAEAVFPFEALQLQIDPESRQIVGHSHAHRPWVMNKNSKPVSTFMFLDPAYAAISAIWATDIDEWVFMNKARKQMVVIHNPLATNPVHVGWLPCQKEYVACQIGPDEYRLEAQAGRLAD